MPPNSLTSSIPEAVFHGQAVKTVAYLRVSTAQQDLQSQRLAILKYARKHDFRIDDFIEATAAGQGTVNLSSLAAFSSLISTKPKPLDRPVSRSVMIRTDSTSPACANRVSRSR